MIEKAHALPTKQFFLEMITRDITLFDCILDLLDNCLDGARNHLKRRGLVPPDEQQYAGYHAAIELGPDRFVIRDNCGGIPVRLAVDYAFHFGRRDDAPADADFSVGLYGIGMKRAMFKIGREIAVLSSTEEGSFVVDVIVDKWAEDPQDWDFDLSRDKPFEPAGTSIEISVLNKGVGGAFADPTFPNRLIDTIARDPRRPPKLPQSWPPQNPPSVGPSSVA